MRNSSTDACWTWSGATIVLSAAGSGTVQADPFAELFRDMPEAGRLDVYAHEDEMQMYLGLADDEQVEIGCANEQGIPQALVQSRDERLQE